MAAVLLATSCKKDDDNNAPANGRDGVHTVSTSTIPFSIKVNTGNSLKKVGYEKSTEENKKGYYSVYFDKNDYAKKLKMVIKTDDKEFGELTLQDDLVTFSGDLKVFPEEGTELTAVVTTDGTEGSEAFSDESLEKLFETCAHTFEGKFNFTYADKDANVTLTDQNVYLAIAMSPCCDHEITINDANFTVQAGTVQAGRIWIAVPAKDGVKSVGLGKEINETEPEPGLIHNVIRQYFTVSSNGKKVHFSKGNLQYNPNATPQWRFAEHQWDFIGGTSDGPHVGTVDGSTNNDAAGPWIDLFGWGMWLKGQDPLFAEFVDNNTNGYYFSKFITQQSESFYNFQSNPPDNFCSDAAIGSEWTTLTSSYATSKKEWNYLLQPENRNTDKKADLFCIGTVNGVHGLILLPDDWTYPSVLSKSIKAFDKTNCTWDDNTYTANEWKYMEANGAVFLPAAGYHIFNSYNPYNKYTDFNSVCRYWSSTAQGQCDSYFITVNPAANNVDLRLFATNSGTRNWALPVRLVRVLN